MSKMKPFLITFVVAILAMAIVNRVGAIRSLVYPSA
jgi:hypothetical protein